MAEVACPQCGNPNLDVDPQNNVVYCKKCGFAVQVNPQTGEVTPLAPGGAQASAPAAYGGDHTIFGTDPLTFLLMGIVVSSILYFMGIFNETWLALLIGALGLFWYWKK